MLQLSWFVPVILYPYERRGIDLLWWCSLVLSDADVAIVEHSREQSRNRGKPLAERFENSTRGVGTNKARSYALYAHIHITSGQRERGRDRERLFVADSDLIRICTAREISPKTLKTHSACAYVCVLNQKLPAVRSKWIFTQTNSLKLYEMTIFPINVGLPIYRS